MAAFRLAHKWTRTFTSCPLVPADKHRTITPIPYRPEFSRQTIQDDIQIHKLPAYTRSLRHLVQCILWAEARHQSIYSDLEGYYYEGEGSLPVD